MELARRFLSVGAEIALLEHRLKTTQHHVCTLMGWKQDHFILVELSSDKEQLFRPAIGAGFHARFENSTRLFAFETKALKLGMSPCPMLFLEYPSMVKELSMRRYRRIRTTIPVTIFSVLTDDGLILDLSEGGALLHTDDEYTKGTSMFLSFQLPNGDKVEHCKCWVRHAKQEEIDPGYQIGVEFVDIENSLERTNIHEPGFSTIG